MLSKEIFYVSFITHKVRMKKTSHKNGQNLRNSEKKAIAFFKIFVQGFPDFQSLEFGALENSRSFCKIFFHGKKKFTKKIVPFR